MSALALFTILSLLIILPPAQANSDVCGQDPGKQRLKPAWEKANESLQKLCGKNEHAKKMIDLAQQCQGADADVKGSASKYLDKLASLCESSNQAVDTAKTACQQNKVAADATNNAKNMISSMAFNGAESEDIQRALVSQVNGPGGVKDQLNNTVQKSAQSKSAIQNEDPKLDENKKTLQEANQEAAKQHRARDRKVWQANSRLKNCRKNCGGPRSAANQARQERQRTNPACQQLTQAQRALERMQKDLKDKLKSLGQEVDGLEKETAEKAAKVEQLAQDHQKFLKEHESLGDGAGKTIKGGYDTIPKRPEDSIGQVGDVHEGRASHYNTTPHKKVHTPEGRNAASNYFPKNSMVEVTNLDNGKKEVVKVTDVGIFREVQPGQSYSSKNLNHFKPSDGRVIDLSNQTAQRLGIRGLGNVRVRRIQ